MVRLRVSISAAGFDSRRGHRRREMIEVYKKPQKDCERCGGTGRWVEDFWESGARFVASTITRRCTCTDFDPTPESTALEAWEDESE